MILNVLKNAKPIIARGEPSNTKRYDATDERNKLNRA